MLWWPFIFIMQAFSIDLTVEKYCYPSESQMRASFRELKTILVPSDKAQADGVCINIQMAPHRHELIQQYLRRLDPSVSISFSSADIRREPCKLKVEKVKNLNQATTSVNIDGSPNAVSSVTESQSTDTMQIQTINEFELSVNQDSIKGNCRYIGPHRYEITLTARKDLKPLLPPTSPGTVVIINQAELPNNQETSSLQTQLSLSRGDKIEIGGVIKDLRGKSREIKIDPSINSEQTNGQSQEKVWLSLE